MNAIVAASGPVVAWLAFCLALVLLVIAASLAWDTGRRIAARYLRRTHRPSWAKWRRTRAAWRAARGRYAYTRLYLDAHWGIR